MIAAKSLRESHVRILLFVIVRVQLFGIRHLHDDYRKELESY